jgi:hypothetical protein
MLLTISAALDEHGHETGHVHSGDFMTDFMNLATDPAHLAFEFVFSIVFDFIIVTLLYGVVIQKIIIPRLRKSIHEEIDREHGVSHPVETGSEDTAPVKTESKENTSNT